LSLDIITSPALEPLRHGFFGRAGGASSGVFAGLNCGQGSTDQAEAVKINRSRVAEAMGVAPEALVGVHQVHSADVVIVEGLDGGPRPRADAMVTNVPGIALSVLTADCQPVLFTDPEAGVIGAAHAGWKGTLNGILEATVEAMERFGARAGRIRAVIGPTISQRAYEVGPEFMDQVLTEDPRAARHFANGHGDRLLFDLPGYGLQRLRQAGVGEAEWTRHCTYSDPSRFFSYRRSVHAREADYGRLIAAIRL
jgi:YfiH family protein